MTTLERLRIRPAIAVAVLAGAVATAGVAGFVLADRTQPGVCFAEQRGACAYEITPHRDGTVTVRREMDNVSPRGTWRVPAECITDTAPRPDCPAGWYSPAPS
ncbi:hypothetical protein [Phytohabitans rumicis]|uniref:Uncharacterized protein n=1 Tax=Phytohabitans rumicis TaxID=1076125 RepID=A0A6V8L7S3_9ACTN|nr:hypothetical protein [Phytohabitans rumicis]GFJ91590.1 hypothetical protein Prum_052320 [Phytohabitans rumicis]